MAASIGTLVEVLDLMELEERLRKLNNLVWTDRNGNTHRVKEMDDEYLHNCINLLNNKITEQTLAEEQYNDALGGDWQG